MMSGLEVTGVVLAILPLLVNQLDNYARGIEKIRMLRRARRHLDGYALAIGTQHTIFIDNIQQALEGVVDDEDTMSELVNNLTSDLWKDPVLQDRLRNKLGRSHGIFVQNMMHLHGLLLDLSQRMGIDLTNAAQDQHEKANSIPFRMILLNAVLEDLLQKIRNVNDTLKTLIDQSTHRETTRKKRRGSNTRLARYRNTRKNAEGLFRAVLEERRWKCHCKEHHCVHLQFQFNPLEKDEDSAHSNTVPGFRVVFSNRNESLGPGFWGWREVDFELWGADEFVTTAKGPASNKRITANDTTTPRKRNTNTRSDIDESQGSPGTGPTAPLIEDFCSSLTTIWEARQGTGTVGFISHGTDSNITYAMQAVKDLHLKALRYSIRDLLSGMSRRDRLHLAAGLACGVLQFYGNWMKPYWESSDIHLAVNNDDHTALLNNLYLSWPLSTPASGSSVRETTYSSPHIHDNILFPLALTLTELSLGKPITALALPEDGSGNEQMIRFNTASRLLKRVYCESGTNYGDVVHSCLFWSGKNSLCLDDKIYEERVFDTVMSPLLEDLLYFEGVHAI